MAKPARTSSLVVDEDHPDRHADGPAVPWLRQAQCPGWSAGSGATWSRHAADDLPGLDLHPTARRADPLTGRPEGRRLAHPEQPEALARGGRRRRTVAPDSRR